jgi:leucyl aminopeptidase (aminopeptidase T)
MNATEVTVQLPREEAEFLEAYAKEHATSAAEIVTLYARRLQSTTRRAPHPENVKFTGSVPADVDVRDAYRKNAVEP